MKKNFRKILIALVLATLAVVGLSACQKNSTSSDSKRAAQTLSALDKSQPVPVFNYSQIRQTLIDAEQAQADTTQTTTFFFNMGVQDPVFVCPSIGFPVPGTDQITNPEVGHWDEPNDNAPYTTQQIEPNGIYGGDTTATFVICVGNNGKPYLHHAEEYAHTVAGPAVWDYTHHVIKVTGDPSFDPKVGTK